MSWDALRDRDSGVPRRTSSRPSRAVTPSLRTQARGNSTTPRNRSLRAAEKPVETIDVVPAAIEEELWFGGHDSSIAEDAAARSMAALVGRIVGAKPFPVSARKLAELTRKDVLRIEPIIQVLERDPGLSARLLRLVNSAGYALRQRCTSVRHAATLVGTDRLHQIATTAAVLDLFDARGTAAAKIIEHSTIVGAFCRYFGAHLALPVDDLFTAGFLHDIGKLMLLETEGEQYFSLLEKYANRPDSIHIIERSLFGFDHAVLAAHVLTEWNIPDPVPKIVAWHHDPTRAYRVSSMMAALVQTVRLADLAVNAMVSGVDQEQFATLASTECASYLDISEPQLSSMWDELQTLYHESIEQCRGENAPALDPRSLRPKQPLNISINAESPRTTELPLQFPCVVCGKPSFGNTCLACGGHMCPEHQEGRDDWCTLCARDFYRVTRESRPTIPRRLAAAIALVTVLIIGSIGYETGGTRGGIRAVGGTLLLLLLVSVLAVVGHRLLLRFRFVRTRPDRAVSEPQESDGGLQSLVPAATDTAQVAGVPHHDLLTEQLRLSGAAIDRVMIREVSSIPSILAPKPFEGLTEAHAPSSRRLSAAPSTHSASAATAPAQAFAAITQTAQFPAALPIPEMNAAMLDDERLAQQGRSLVTLPAPSRATHVEQETHVEHQSRIDPLPIRSVESSDFESDERTSELGLNVLAATPQSEPPIGLSTPPTLRPPEEPSAEANPSVPSQKPRGSGTYPSSPPPAIAEVEPATSLPTLSQHPLAALGIDPHKYSKPTRHELIAPNETTNPDRTPTTKPPSGGRKTLTGLSAFEIQQALAAPREMANDASLQTPTVREPVIARQSFEPRKPYPPSTDTEPSPNSVALTQVVSPAELATEMDVLPEPSQARTVDPVELPQLSTLPSSRPPATQAGALGPAPMSPQLTPGMPALPELTNLEQQLLAKMGPEFQTQVMTLIAERVATAVAERMLESLGHGVAKPHPPSTSRIPKARKAAAVSEPSVLRTKASRRKAPHG